VAVITKLGFKATQFLMVQPLPPVKTNPTMPPAYPEVEVIENIKANTHTGFLCGDSFGVSMIN
jgi:hypothetical protein